MKHIRYVLSFMLLLSIFSVKTFAQDPGGDGPGDPGGDIYTYENGYCEGAIAAVNFKELLDQDYDGQVRYVTWYLYDAWAEGCLGEEVDFNSPGLKIPVVTYTSQPNSAILSNSTVKSYLRQLESVQYESDFDYGYFSGFHYHWYN